MQTTVDEAINRLESLTNGAPFLEFGVLLTTGKEIMDCRINKEDGTIKVLSKRPEEMMPVREPAESFTAALGRLIEICGKGKLFIDTLTVLKSETGYLKPDNSIFAAARDALLSQFGSKAVAVPADLNSQNVQSFSEQLSTIQKSKSDVWLRIKTKQLLKLELRSALACAETHDTWPGYINVYLRSDPFSPYEGKHFRASHAACAAAVAMVFIAGEVDELLTETLIVKVNRLENNDPNEICGVSDPIYSAALQFCCACCGKSNATASGADPVQVRDEEARKSLLIYLKSGKTGINLFNNAPRSMHSRLDSIALDLTKCDLSAVEFGRRHFEGSNFSQSCLKKMDANATDFSNCSFKEADLSQSKLIESKAINADFDGATLEKAKLHKSNFRGATFAGADISGADFKGADICDADFSACRFSTPPSFVKAIYNEQTKLPPGFSNQKDLVWVGQGPDPYKVSLIDDLNKSGLDFSGFMELLNRSYDQSRISKSVSMLKKESFQLFAEQNTSGTVGIIKSQTDPDLFYACQLGETGNFACCTQNLNPCGGLRGALCKHILVLVIGLAKAGKIDTSEAAKQILASASQKPELNKDLMTELFLRYKGVAAGEIDWRPTETIPEDYFAF